ncbi:MAG: hypothetical protein MJK12_06525 [Colwellia sp.]|nr:hypothetical protein [Colwellia sp.]
MADSVDVDEYCQMKMAIFSDDSNKSNKLKQQLMTKGIKEIWSLAHESVLFNNETPLDYDIIFLFSSNQYNVEEIVEELKFRERLSISTRIVFLTGEQKVKDSVSEQVFLTHKVIDDSAQLSDIEQQLSEHLLIKNKFKASFDLIDQCLLKKAFLTIKDINVKEQPRLIKNLINKTLIYILLELGQYQTASKMLKPLCDNGVLWAQWAMFTVHYERANISECELFLHDKNIKKLTPRKVFHWNIYLAMKKKKYSLAKKMIVGIPSQNMSIAMFRLSVTVLTLAGDFDLAYHFISRKLSTVFSSDPTYQILSLAISRAALLEIIQNKQPKTQLLLKRSTKSLEKLKSNSQNILSSFDYIYLKYATDLLLNEGDSNSEQLQKINHDLLEHLHDPVEMICACYVNHIAKNEDIVFELIYQVNCSIVHLNHSCRGIVISLMFQTAFDLIYQKSAQPIIYKKLAERHLLDKNYKLAAKMFLAAFNGNSKEQQYLISMKECLGKAGIKEYRGISLK